jgi:glycosyltransferase involved in cell wall biosynthesis
MSEPEAVSETAESYVDRAFRGATAEIKHKYIVYRGDSGACWYYRIHLPLSFLTRNHHEYGVMVSFAVSSDQFGNFETAIFQRQHKKDVFDAAMQLRKHGAKLIYEIDDDVFSVPDWNPTYTHFGKRKVQDQVKYFLEWVDAVFVTTPTLQKVYAPYNEHIYVLPNSIAFEAHHPAPNNSLRKVVCWQGSDTHKNDLKLIRKHIEKLALDNDALVKMWSVDFPNTHRVPAVEFKSFHAVFSQVDATIGLAPLVPCTFNLSKSNLKFLEYTAQGVVTVASNYGPYAEAIKNGTTGLLICDNATWYDAIRTLLDNVELRAMLLKNALVYVKDNYDLSKNYILWKNALDEIALFEPKKGIRHAYF